MKVDMNHLFVNLQRVYATVGDGKCVDITGALADPASVRDILLGEDVQKERRRIAEEEQRRVLDEMDAQRGARI